MTSTYVARAVAYIRARGEANTREIAAHLGDPLLNVSGLLSHMVDNDTLVVRLARVDGRGRAINHYRLNQSRRATKMTPRHQSGGANEMVTPAAAAVTHPSAADSAHDQPAVSDNTGSAGVAPPLCGGPRRTSPSPSIAQTMARLEGEGEVRYGLGKDGCLAIRDGKTAIQLNRYQTFLLGRLMAGTVSVWGL